MIEYSDYEEMDWREGQTLILLLLDSDALKAFNAKFGHPGGDELLRRVAALLVSVIREGDFADQMAPLDRRLNRALAELDLAPVRGPDRRFARPTQTHVIWRHHPPRNRALYMGKHNGKNQVVTATFANSTDFLMLVAA